MIISQLERGIGLRWREDGEGKSKIVDYSEFRPYMFVDKDAID